jgi:hypothetical protein
VAEFYRARQSFAAPVGGYIQVIPEGHLLSDEDPLFRAHPQQFVRLAEHLDRTKPVEDTTAVPGEKRHVTLPQPTRAAKPRKDTEDAAPPTP